MCSVDAPEPQVIEQAKPTMVRNPYLDELDNDAANADALRRGRTSLVIPTGTGLGFSGRGSGGAATSGGTPNGNGRNPIGGRGLGIPGTGSGPYEAGPNVPGTNTGPRGNTRGGGVRARRIRN